MTVQSNFHSLTFWKENPLYRMAAVKNKKAGCLKTFDTCVLYTIYICITLMVIETDEQPTLKYSGNAKFMQVSSCKNLR